MSPANPYVQAGLSAKGLAWVWHSDVARNWHPVTMLSHMLDCQLYGLRPGGHHLTSLLFHIANTRPAVPPAVEDDRCAMAQRVVAALFALHPLHVESVAWVAERKDVLSTFFFLLTLWAYVRMRKVEAEIRRPKSEGRSKPKLKTEGRIGKPMRRYYWLALVLFALGLMSKPMLVTVPFVLLLLDFWPLGRLRLS